MKVSVKFRGSVIPFELESSETVGCLAGRLVHHIDPQLSAESIKLVGGGIKKGLKPMQCPEMPVADAGALQLVEH